MDLLLSYSNSRVDILFPLLHEEALEFDNINKYTLTLAKNDIITSSTLNMKQHRRFVSQPLLTNPNNPRKHIPKKSAHKLHTNAGSNFKINAFNNTNHHYTQPNNSPKQYGQSHHHPHNSLNNHRQLNYIPNHQVYYSPSHRQAYYSPSNQGKPKQKYFSPNNQIQQQNYSPKEYGSNHHNGKQHHQHHLSDVYSGGNASIKNKRSSSQVIMITDNDGLKRISSNNNQYNKGFNLDKRLKTDYNIYNRYTPLPNNWANGDFVGNDEYARTDTYDTNNNINDVNEQYNVHKGIYEDNNNNDEYLGNKGSNLDNNNLGKTKKRGFVIKTSSSISTTMKKDLDFFTPRLKTQRYRKYHGKKFTMDKIEKTIKVDKMDKMENKVDKNDKDDKIDKGTKPDKVNKVEKADKADKMNSIDRISKVNGADKVSKVDKIYRVDGMDNKTSKMDEDEKIIKADRVAETQKIEQKEEIMEKENEGFEDFEANFMIGTTKIKDLRKNSPKTIEIKLTVNNTNSPNEKPNKSMHNTSIELEKENDNDNNNHHKNTNNSPIHSNMTFNIMQDTKIDSIKTLDKLISIKANHELIDITSNNGKLNETNGNTNGIIGNANETNRNSTETNGTSNGISKSSNNLTNNSKNNIYKIRSSLIENVIKEAIDKPLLTSRFGSINQNTKVEKDNVIILTPPLLHDFANNNRELGDTGDGNLVEDTKDSQNNNQSNHDHGKDTQKNSKTQGFSNFDSNTNVNSLNDQNNGNNSSSGNGKSHDGNYNHGHIQSKYHSQDNSQVYRHENNTSSSRIRHSSNSNNHNAGHIPSHSHSQSASTSNSNSNSHSNSIINTHINDYHHHSPHNSHNPHAYHHDNDNDNNTIRHDPFIHVITTMNRNLNIHNMFDLTKSIDPDESDLELFRTNEVISHKNIIDSEQLFLKKIDDLTISYVKEICTNSDVFNYLNNNTNNNNNNNNNNRYNENDGNNNNKPIEINAKSFYIKSDEPEYSVFIENSNNITTTKDKKSNSNNKEPLNSTDPANTDKKAYPNSKKFVINIIPPPSQGSSSSSSPLLASSLPTGSKGAARDIEAIEGGVVAIDELGTVINSFKEDEILTKDNYEFDNGEKMCLKYEFYVNEKAAVEEVNEKPTYMISNYASTITFNDYENMEISNNNNNNIIRSEISCSTCLPDIDDNDKDMKILMGSNETLAHFDWDRCEIYFSKEESTYNFFYYFESIIRKKYPLLIKNYYDKMKAYENYIIKNIKYSYLGRNSRNSYDSRNTQNSQCGHTEHTTNNRQSSNFGRNELNSYNTQKTDDGRNGPSGNDGHISRDNHHGHENHHRYESRHGQGHKSHHGHKSHDGHESSHGHESRHGHESCHTHESHHVDETQHRHEIHYRVDSHHNRHDSHHNRHDSNHNRHSSHHNRHISEISQYGNTPRSINREKTTTTVSNLDSITNENSHKEEDHIRRYDMLDEDLRLREYKNILDSQNIVNNQKLVYEHDGDHDNNVYRMNMDMMQYEDNYKKNVIKSNNGTLVHPIRLNEINHIIHYNQKCIIVKIDYHIMNALIQKEESNLPISLLYLSQFDLKTIKHDEHMRAIFDIITNTDMSNRIYIINEIKQEYEPILTGKFESLISIGDIEKHFKKSNTKDHDRGFSLNPLKRMIDQFETRLTSLKHSNHSEINNEDKSVDLAALNNSINQKNHLQRFHKYHFEELDEKEEPTKNSKEKKVNVEEEENSNDKEKVEQKEGIKKRGETKESNGNDITKSNTISLNELRKTPTNEFDSKNVTISGIGTDRKKFSNLSSILLKRPAHVSTTGSFDDKVSTLSTPKYMKKLGEIATDDNRDEEPPKEVLNYLQRLISTSIKNQLYEFNLVPKNNAFNMQGKPYEGDDTPFQKESTTSSLSFPKKSHPGKLSLTNSMILKNSSALRTELSCSKMDKGTLLMRTHMLSLEKKKKLNLVEKMFLTVQENKILELEDLFLHFPSYMIDTKDSSGNTLLAIASQCGFLDILNFLIYKGANVNTQNNEGNTPLHLALAFSHNHIADRLVQAGAAQNIKNNDGKKPWELCRYS